MITGTLPYTYTINGGVGIIPSTNGWSATVQKYNITVIPTLSSLSEIHSIIEDTTNDTYNWSASSDTLENPTWFNVTVKNASKNYRMKINNSADIVATSGSDKNVS